MNKLILYLRLLRISSWGKNVLIFTPIFFAKAILDIPKLLDVVVAAIAFCFVASTMYVLNDLADYEQDRKHAHKKNRPIAANLISRKEAIGILFALLIIDALFLSFLSIKTAAILFIYVFLNVLYSFSLKHVMIMDVLLVSSFYVLRILTGGFAADVPVSSWLIITTFFIALLLVLGKRKAELSHENRRPVMAHYSESFLNAMLVIAAGLTIISYSLYILIVHSEPLAVYSIFFVLLGVMRYLLLIYNGHNVESPEKIIWGDRGILASIACWLIVMYLIFYFTPTA